MFRGCLYQCGTDAADVEIKDDHDHGATLRAQWLAAGCEQEHYMDMLEKLPTASEQKRAFLRISLRKGVPLSIAARQWSNHPLVVARREASIAKSVQCQAKRAEARARKREAKMNKK